MDPYYSNLPSMSGRGGNHYNGRNPSVGSYDSGSSSTYSSYSQHGMIYSSNRLGPAATKNTKDITQNMFFNTTKKSWDCGLCRKGFKEKKDLEQHLNSGTHDEIKYSCSECGKGFASLGALTLHIEQAGHTSKNKHVLQDAHSLASGASTLEMTSTGLYMDMGPESFLNSARLAPAPVAAPQMRASHGSIPFQQGPLGPAGNRMGPGPRGVTGFDSAPLYRGGPPGPGGAQYGSEYDRYQERDPYRGYGGEGSHLHPSMMPPAQRGERGFGQAYPPRYGRGGYDDGPGYGAPPPYHGRGGRFDPRDPRGGFPQTGPERGMFPGQGVAFDPVLPPLDDRMFYLTIAGYVEKHLLEAGCCFVLTDEAQMAVLEDSFVISQFHTGSMQPEYEALCEGLSKALETGIRNIKVYTATEPMFIQLNTGNPLLYCQTIFRSVDPLFAKVKRLCYEFRHIEVELVPKDFTAAKVQLAKTALYEYKFPPNVVIPTSATPASIITNSTVSTIGAPKDGKLDPVAAAVAASVSGKLVSASSAEPPGFSNRTFSSLTTMNSGLELGLGFDLSQFSQLAGLTTSGSGSSTLPDQTFRPIDQQTASMNIASPPLSVFSLSSILGDDIVGGIGSTFGDVGASTSQSVGVGSSGGFGPFGSNGLDSATSAVVSPPLSLEAFTNSSVIGRSNPSQRPVSGNATDGFARSMF